MARYQYYLLNHPDDINSSSYNSYRCINRFSYFGDTSSTKLIKYESIGNCFESSISSKYVKYNLSTFKQINDELNNAGIQENMNLSLYDIPTNSNKYLTYNDDNLYLINKPVIPKISSWLHGYYHGGLVIQTTTNLTNYLEYYDLTKSVLEFHISSSTIYLSSQNGYSSPFSSYYSNYSNPYLIFTNSKYICVFHEFKIGLGMKYIDDFNESDTNNTIYYIGTTSDFITFNVCLVMNQSVLIDNGQKYSALSGFSINTAPISSSIHIYTPINTGASGWGATDVYVTTSSSIRLNIFLGEEINLMDYFDEIMSSKFSGYNSTNHSVYINGSTHYFYIITLGSITYTGLEDPSYNSLTSYDFMKIVLAKSCSGGDDPENMENLACMILDIFVRSNKLYIYPFAVLSIKNLTYYFYANTSIPYQYLGDLCSDYMVSTDVDPLYTSSSEPDRDEIQRAQCGYDAMYVNSFNTNDTYWYSPDTYNENIGKCIVTSYSYSYSYSF